jgi:predicted AAA+ superfamily ATPase
MQRYSAETPFERLLAPTAIDLMAGLRAVVLQGPRQAGKTTLARQMADQLGARLISLDDPAALEAVRIDPTGFLDAYPRPLCLDEFQRGGEAFVLALKSELDRSRTRGQFLLTSSTNFLALPTFSESLAGRIGLATLWPHSQGELERRPGGFLDRAFRDPESLRGYRATLGRSDYFERLTLGGYPEVHGLTPRQRDHWFAAYAETLIERNVAELAEVRDGQGLRSFVRLAAVQTAQELVIKSLADGVGIQARTATRWLAWLEAIFLVHLVPAWSPNPTRRVIHRPKSHIVDTGLCAHLLGKSGRALAEPTDPVAGALLESFVVGELMRQSGWSETRTRLHHLREHRGPEVDIVVEATDGRVVAFEVKATRSRPGAGSEPLTELQQRLAAQPGRFVHGFVLYTGEQAHSLGPGLTALPIEALWRAS